MLTIVILLHEFVLQKPDQSNYFIGSHVNSTTDTYHSNAFLCLLFAKQLAKCVDAFLVGHFENGNGGQEIEMTDYLLPFTRLSHFLEEKIIFFV